MEDKKISLLISYNYQTGSGNLNIDDIINKEVIVPVIVDNLNKKLNIGQIFLIIKLYFLLQINTAVYEYINNNQDTIRAILSDGS